MGRKEIMYAANRLTVFFLCFAGYTLQVLGQDAGEQLKTYPPMVNQAGYNLGESKRFVCYGAKDRAKFRIINTHTDRAVYEGEIIGYQGWFSSFNPIASSAEYVIDVEGHGRSFPFWIADHLMENLSSKLAYDFFVDARGFEDNGSYNISQVYGGGPTRDVGAYGLETVFEVLQYASNPALFDRWKTEIGEDNTADLIDLILWHAEFAYKYVKYNGPVLNRHGSLGYEGEPRMNYDYWNTLDQLAAVCAAYHFYLKAYLPEETYRKYRKVCLENWEEYDRHKVVRYWTYSTKWVDHGFQEFNEMGNAFGQSVFSNLFMYLCEKSEDSQDADRFLKWAKESAKDIVENWDFDNPRHMWWIRNAEHITPQALAFFLLVAPEEAPAGARKKLAAWASHIKRKSNNFWKYRVHSESEWAHEKTKELGGAPALGGSLFAASYLLEDPSLRQLGWAQIDFVFGINPVGTHLSNKSPERVEIGGFWKGVETGWPQSHPDGYGRLGLVRGTLDGSPLNSQFPIAQVLEESVGKNEGKAFGENAYATEGWGVSNRGWMATLTFSTLGSHRVRWLDTKSGREISTVRPGQSVEIELRAALNLDWNRADEGWIDIYYGSRQPERLALEETGINTGVFTAKISVPENDSIDAIRASYGYLGFEKETSVKIDRTK